MPSITDSVGENGRNAAHDVAIVQFMLKVLKNSAGLPYFAGGHSDSSGNSTVRALVAFQAGGGAGGEPAGLVRPGSATWRSLLSAFNSSDATLRTARTMAGFDLVYAAMPQNRAEHSLSELHAVSNLQPEFRSKVAQLIRTFYDQSGIACSLVSGTGGWRQFSAQEGLVSKAGIGESTHEYGYAVDLVVTNFTWFAPDLRRHTSHASFQGIQNRYVEQLLAARDEIASRLKLFRTVVPGDLGHLQNFDDNTLDSVSSLMELMHDVGPRKMKWVPQFRQPTNYLCDLGLGGDLYYAGTSVSIWHQDSSKRISESDLAKALGAKKKADPRFSLDSFLGRSGKPLPTQPTASDISASDIQAVQVMLKVEFDAAAKNWRRWQPVLYPGGDRRPLNPHPS